MAVEAEWERQLNQNDYRYKREIQDQEKTISDLKDLNQRIIDDNK